MAESRAVEVRRVTPQLPECFRHSYLRSIPEPIRRRWAWSSRADDDCLPLADRHYSRQRPGSAQFVAPGRCICLKSVCRQAVWVPSWPFKRYTQHAWARAWVNSLFRNEGAGLSSELIREAVVATRTRANFDRRWGPPPSLGIVSFVDASKTRRKRDPARCYRRGGFRHVGFTQSGLWVLQMLPDEMPGPVHVHASPWSEHAA